MEQANSGVREERKKRVGKHIYLAARACLALLVVSASCYALFGARKREVIRAGRGSWREEGVVEEKDAFVSVPQCFGKTEIYSEFQVLLQLSKFAKWKFTVSECDMLGNLFAQVKKREKEFAGEEQGVGGESNEEQYYEGEELEEWKSNEDSLSSHSSEYPDGN